MTQTELLQNRYEQNINAFKKNFSELYKIHQNDFGKLPNDFEIIPSKTDSSVFTAKHDDLFLHSAYAPIKETEKLLNGEMQKYSDQQLNDFSAVVLYGTGLGYLLQQVFDKFPKKTIILVEPDINFISASFFACDLSKIINSNRCILCFECTIQAVLKIVENFSIENCLFIEQKQYTNHANHYFTDLSKLIERNKQKKQINNKTLKTFSSLWFSNMSHNAKQIVNLEGITHFQDKAQNLPTILIAAGPSLQKILPHLQELKKKAILVCVDTALRSVIEAGVEPHFVVLTDPQYWNCRHLDRLHCKETILITDLTAHKSVFRFDCKQILLCSSIFAFSKYIESRVDPKGSLGTGGSVASTAFDFCHYIGSNQIFLAGLDLSFPNKKTHIKNSTFEQKTFITSNKIANSETMAASALFGANPILKQNYEGKNQLTDSRMLMYAWWFESKIAQYSDTAVYTLTPESLQIPGVKVFDLQTLLKSKNIETEIAEFLQNIPPKELQIQNEKIRNEKFTKAINELNVGLTETINLVSKGIKLTKSTNLSKNEFGNVFYELNQIDKKIAKSEISDLVSILFPTEDVLQEELNKLPQLDSKDALFNEKQNIQKTNVIYKCLINALENCGKFVNSAL